MLSAKHKAARLLHKLQDNLNLCPNPRVERHYRETGQMPQYHREIPPVFHNRTERQQFARSYNQPDRSVSDDLASQRAKWVGRRYVPAGALNWNDQASTLDRVREVSKSRDCPKSDKLKR